MCKRWGGSYRLSASPLCAFAWPRTGYQDVGEKKYKRMTRALKPDLEHYAQQKAKLGDLVYPTADSVAHADLVPLEQSRVEKLAELQRQQDAARLNRHKRKRYDPNAEVDYINAPNAIFNEKISKAFDAYTREIKANLERGTAL